MIARFENVNIIEALRKIMLHNTEHYQSDFEYDIKSLQEAAEDSEGSRHFLWLSRGCGTWCFEERDVYIRNTHAFNTWDYYNNSSENVKAFAVEIERLQNKAVIVKNFRSCKAAIIHVVTLPTLPSTVGLSLGFLTRAGRTAQP